VVLAPPTEDRNPGEATFGLELYQHEIDESLDTLVPLATPHDGLLFLDPKFTLSDRLNPTIAVGIGYRHLFEGPKVILGGNLFYESDVSPYDQHYNEFGFGAEVLSRWVDWRANYYLPEQNSRGINSKQTVSLSRKVTSSNQALGPQITSDSVSFAGHNLIETTNGMNETLTTTNVTDTATTHFWEQYESGMRGVDTELGFLIPGLDKYAETRVFGGYYYFDNPFGKNVQGFKGRLEIRALPSVTLDAAYYENKAIVGSNWYYGIRISTPFDIGNIAHGKNPFEGFLEGFKPQHTDEQERFASRLSENIIRNPHVSLAQSKFIDVKDKVQVVDPPTTTMSGTPFTTTTILTMGGAPITITHVNSAATSPGDGTFAHPYISLSLADSDVVKRNIVLLYANSIFNSQTISLALGQQLLGSSVTNYVKTDQLGTIALPKAGTGTVLPVISNPGGTTVTVAGNNVISGLNLQNSVRGISAPSGVTNLLVQRSIISNMTDVGIGLDTGTSSGTTISNVTFTNNHQDAIINGSGTTIANTTSTGATNGALQLNNTSGTTTVSDVSVTNAGAYAVQFNNSGGTHNIGGLNITGGSGFGVDIESGSGAFTFDSASSITGTGGAAFHIFGGSTNVTYAGNISQTFNAPAVAVLGGHTGTVKFEDGTVSATAGQGLLFDDANGTYNFLGTTSLKNGANLQILDNSAGAFDFGSGTSITNGTNQDIFVSNSTASMTYSGNVSEDAGTILQVNNHSTGTLQFDTGTLTATGGNGLQFNAADGTYKFLGTVNLNGGTAAVDILNNSTGTFQFDTKTTITDPTATAFFVNGGSANITYSGSIAANSNFALEVINHSTGTMNFNTGNINATGGNGVQFSGDSGTYNLADVRGSNIAGSAIEVDNSASGTFTLSSVTINGTTATAVQLNNAGTVNLLGGKIDGAGGDGIFALNTTLTATGLTLGSTTAISGIGVNVTNNDGTDRTVTISNDSIRSHGSGIVTTDGGHAKELTLVLDGDTIQTLNGGSEAIDVTGSALNSTIVKSMNGGTVIGNGTGGGVFFHEVTFDASGTALTGAQVAAGTWNIGQGVGIGPVQRVLNDGLHIDGPTGSLDFTQLDIHNNAGTGLLVDTKTLGTTFTLDTGGTSLIDTTGGTAMSIDPLTTNMIFSSVTSANSPGAGVIVNGLTSGSQLTIGTTTVTASNGSGIVVQNSNGATINFGTTTVTSAGGNGIDLSGAGGANVGFGTTQVTNAVLSGINMANSSGTFTFGNTTINGTAAGQTAFNLNGSSANVTATSLNVNGGGIGIDLRNTQGNTVTILNGGTIQNVGVGVQLGGGTTGDYTQTANAFFTFDTTGGHNSTISGTVAIEARGLVSTASNVDGTYDFRNVTNITGAENFEPTAGTPFFVAATALGNGSGADPDDAAAFTGIAGTPAGTFIVLVNDGSTINIGASTITLQANDHVDTFGNGRTFAAGAAPVNILLPGAVQFTDPFGNGAATITGTGTIFNAASGDLLQNFTITLNGGTAIAASGITNLSTSNLTINGTGNVFSLTNDSGSISLTNNNINVSGGQLLGVSGGNATINLAAGTGSITNTGGSGISVTGTTGGNVTVTGVNVTGATSTPLNFDNNKATFNITGSTFVASFGVTLLTVDTGTGGSTSALTFGATDTLMQTNHGVIAIIGSGARDIDLSAQNFLNNVDTFATNVIESTGQSGGTISFGSVSISDFFGTTAVDLQGTGGAVTFKSLSVDTQGGAGVSTGGITFAPGSASGISTIGGSALVMNGTTISGGAETFANITATSAGAGTPGISLTNVTGATTISFVNITIPNSTGINLNNAGTVTLKNGTIDGSSSDAIHSVNTTLSATGLTIGGTNAPSGNGVTIINNDGTQRLVTLSNDTITAANNAISTTDGGHVGELTLVLDGDTLQSTSAGTVALSVAGTALNSTIVKSMNGGTVIANATNGGGVEFEEVTFDASGTALSGTPVNAGNWNIGQGTGAGQRVQGDGLNFTAPTGSVAFGTLNIFNNAGTGLLVNTKGAGTTFSLANTASTIDTTNGTAMSLDPLTAHLTFSSVSSTNAVNGVVLNTVGGTVALGTVNVSTASGIGLEMINSSAAVTASSLTVNGAATGLQFGTNTGSFAVSGATSLTNITGTGINANGATGTYTFADTTIGFTGAGRGLDLRNSDATFTTGTLAITGDGTAGSIGLDLSGSTNPNGVNAATANILLANGAGQTAAISDVATGVLLGDATAGSAGAYLKYGNQTPTSSGGSGSSISVISGGFTIDTTHLTSVNGFDQGRYEFNGVSFTGNASFQISQNLFFVAANATGTGNGTTVNDAANVTTLLNDLSALSLANKTIVLINDGNPINLGANTLALDANTNIDGFGNGNSVMAFTIPQNVILDAFGGTISDPTGNGAATLEASSGKNVVTLNGANSITNISITGGNFLVAGTGITGLTVKGDGLSGGGTGVFSLTNATGTVNLTNNTINQSGGSLLTVSGGSAGITLSAGTGSISNTAGSGINISGTTGGSVTLTGLSVTGATATPLTFDNNKATFAITNSTFAVNSGVTLLNVDTTIGGSTSALTFGGTDTLTQTSGEIADIGAGSRNIDLSAQNFTNTGTTAGNVISVAGQSGGTIAFGTVNISGYNAAAGTAVSLLGTAGTDSFVNLTVATTAGAGVNVGGVTFAPGSSPSISTVGGPALVMNGTTVSGGTETFSSVSATNAGAPNSAISLTNVTGSTTFTTVNLSGTATNGIKLNNAGTVSVLGGTVDGTSGDAINSTNTALTVTGVTIGGTTAPGGNGITVVNNDGTERLVTLSNDNIKATDSAISTTDGGHAKELTLALDGDTLHTFTTGDFALSVTGSALNSTIVQSMNGGTLTGGIASGTGAKFNEVTFDASGTALSGTQVNAGTWNIGQGPAAAQRVAGNGLELLATSGNLSFSTLNIYNTLGVGLLVNTPATTFTLGNTAGTIDSSTGEALSLNSLTAHLTFGTVNSTNAALNGADLTNVSGSVALGNVGVTSAAFDGINVTGSSATITASSINVNGAADGLVFGNNTGSFTVSGTTSLTATTGIEAQNATGSYSFVGNTTINFTGANRGLDLRDSNLTQFSTGNLTITGDGTAGSIGLDLSGSKYPTGQPVTNNAPNVSLATGAGQTAAISNVGTGILLGTVADGSAGAYLRYGNQTPTGSGGSGSSISVIGGGLTLDTSHLTSTTGFQVGRYEFLGVSFTGSASFQASANFFFVAANATGTGDGSSVNNRADAATLLTDLGTNSLAGETIVLINDGNVISLGNATTQLDAGTNINGFGNGNSVSAFTIPVNVIIDSFTGTVTDPTGKGAATLTANTGNNVVTLSGTNSIQNVNLTGGNYLVAGTGITGLTVQGVGLSGAGTGVFNLTTPTGTISITNNTINQSGGSLLVLNGGSANLSFTAGTGSISNTAGSGINISGTTGGSVTLTGLSVTAATATPLTFDNNKATFAITSSTFAVNSGVTLLNVDTTIGGSTSALTFGATDTLTQTSGEIAAIGSGARNIDLSAQNFTNTGTTAGSVISVTGQSGGTIAFGTIGISGYNNAGGTAVSLQGAAGTDSFSNLTVATNDGAGVNVGGVTFAPGSSPSISTVNGPALVMNGTTISGGSETFSSVASNNAGPVAGQISLTNVTGSTTFTTVNLFGAQNDGIKLNNAGTVSVLGGTINSSTGDAINSTNTTLTVTGMTIGGVIAPDGNGITVVNNDGNQRLVTLSNDNIQAVGNAIATTDGGHAGELTLVLDGDTLRTTTTGDYALSVIGSALNSTIVKSMNGGTITGGTNSGGVLFNTVTFDASGTALSGTQVNAGTWNIGQSTSVRVQGNGLDFTDPTGNLTFAALNIFNNAGTGLLVNTKTPSVTTFTLGDTTSAVDTTNGTATSLDPLTANLTFTSLKSTGAVNGVVLNTVGGTVALGAVNVSTASGIGLEVTNSSATVTASSVTVNGAATGLQFGANTGSFTVSGTTSVTGITGTGINANGATGSYTFTGNTTIVFSGAGRGIDFRGSDLTQFNTGNISITGDGATAGSIAIDLSGSQYLGGQPVGTTSPNISLATGAGQTASISGVQTGVLLGNAANGSAGAYLRYGDQTSGSSIAVNSGGFTIDTTDLMTVSASQRGRYEFNGVSFTGTASFESSNTSFIFVGSTSAGSASGGDPSDRISLANFLANDNTTGFLAGKTIIFVNDNGGAGLTLGSTLNLGTGTTIESFGNNATVVVPGGVQPANVIGTFHASGGTFTDANGAATLKAANTINLITLSNGDTVQNIDLTTGNNQIIGSNTAGFTLAGVLQTNANASAISLTNSTGTISMTGGSISGAGGPSFLINGGTSTVSYSGTITNTAGNSVEVESRTSGSVTLSGTITDTGLGILVQNNTGGTTTFSGASDSIHTGANQAITLANNTGSTTDFTGGGLSITTTSGAAFGASGGGTVGVTGTGNVLTSTTGTALSLNGVAIDTNGFVLQSVTATGAANGIALTNLTGGGTTGVQVTGSGSTAGSGGTISNTTGAAVSLSALGSLGGGVTLNNVIISGGGGITGTTFGTLSASNDSVSASSFAALNLTTGTVATGSTFSTLTASGTLTNGVLLTTVGGGFTATSGSLGTSSGAVWSESGGTVSATYNGTITQSTAATNAIVISGETAGTTTFGGAISATNATTATAINLTGNTGATIVLGGTGSTITTTTGTGINFANGGTLKITGNNYSISTGSGTGISASNTGALANAVISATGTGNIITTTSGTALSVTNTTIAATNLTFQKISAGAGANDGIVLDTTGTLGGLVVTGTGTTAGSGGTISGKTGGDGSTTGGIGIYLNSTADVSLANMDIEGNSNYGIRGNSVTNFSLTGSTIGKTSTNGTSNTADTDTTGYNGEGSVRFYDLLGTNSITNSTIDKGFAKSLAVSNDTGTSTLTITNSTINNTLGTGSSDAVYFQTSGTANGTLTINGGTFSSYLQNAVETNAQSGSTMTVNISGSTFTNNNANMVSASNMIVMNVTGANTFLTFLVNNNTFNNANPAADSGPDPALPGRIITAGTLSGSGTVYGTLTNNSFGAAGVTNSGGGPGADSVGLFVAGNNGTHGASEFLIQNNTFQEYGQTGVQVGATSGNATVDATFLGNTFKNPGSVASGAFAAIWAYAGANNGDTNTLNILIGGSGNQNFMTGSWPAGSGGTDVLLGSGAPNGATINLSQGSSVSTNQQQVIVDDNVTDNPPLSSAEQNDGVTTIHVVGTTPPIPPP
jgi:hypothetical protein